MTLAKHQVQVDDDQYDELVNRAKENARTVPKQLRQDLDELKKVRQHRQEVQDRKEA